MENKWNDKAVLERVKRKVLDNLEVAGKFVEDNAKLLCPVDTDLLRESITHRVFDTDLSVIIGTPVEYGPWVEFGTGEYAEDGQGRKGGWFYVTDKPVVAGWLKPLYETEDGKFVYFTYGSKPKPFLRPAFLENKEAIKKILAL